MRKIIRSIFTPTYSWFGYIGLGVTLWLAWRVSMWFILMAFPIGIIDTIVANKLKIK